jgi:hypothetical protein
MRQSTYFEQRLYVVVHYIWVVAYNMERYECYHGTDQEACDSILASRHFRISDSDTEWAGDGIYFFPVLYESEENPAFDNAIKWAKYFKRFDPQCVIKAIVLIDQNEILNLTDQETIDIFNKYRRENFDDACRRAEAAGIKINRKYLKANLNSKKLDCTTINDMCTDFNSKAVMRQANIMQLRFGLEETNFKYPISCISNCTIFCLRDESLISELSKAL